MMLSVFMTASQRVAMTSVLSEASAICQRSAVASFCRMRARGFFRVRPRSQRRFCDFWRRPVRGRIPLAVVVSGRGGIGGFAISGLDDEQRCGYRLTRLDAV